MDRNDLDIVLCSLELITTEINTLCKLCHEQYCTNPCIMSSNSAANTFLTLNTK